MTRREMLRTSLALGGATLFAPQLFAATVVPEDRKFTEQLGWKIGPQIYSFNRFPFDEAIKLVAACGTASFEQYAGQKVSKEININVGPDLLKPENKDALKRVKDLLAEYGCSMHAIGVCPGDRRHFEFATEFGIPVLNCEPGFDRIPEVNKLAEEFKINVGLHNHPKPSIYWDPEIVLAQLKESGPRVGACCDTGHWLRSGLSPLQGIRKLKGRIASFHIKDLKWNAGRSNFDADCPLGQGEVGIAAILKEFATHDTKGNTIPFSIEFEAAWDNNQPQVAESVKFFDAAAKQIAAAKR